MATQPENAPSGDIDQYLHQTTLSDNIKIRPTYLGSNVKDHIESRIKELYDGKCSKFGFIQRNSVKLARIGRMQVELATLGGFVDVEVIFEGNVFNPSEGTILNMNVKMVNAFGAMAVIQMDGIMVMQIIIPRQIAIASMDGINAGDFVNVEVVKRKMMPGDELLYAIGRVVPLDIQSSSTINNVTNHEDQVVIVDTDNAAYDDISVSSDSSNDNDETYGDGEDDELKDDVGISEDDELEDEEELEVSEGGYSAGNLSD